VSDPRKAPAARALTCPRCGALNSAEFRKCIRCASALPRGGEAVADSPSPRPRPGGGRAEEGSEERDYRATKTFIGATLLIYGAQLLSAIKQGAGIASLWVDFPGDSLRFGALQIDVEAVRAEPFRLLSYMFVHAGVVHFGFNMMGLVNFGRVAEPAIGAARLTIVYVLSGLAGALATLAPTFFTGPSDRTVGASGAIFGVMGLVLGWLIRRRDPAWKDFAVQSVLYSVLFGFIINAAGTNIVINNWAHLGGLFCGVVFGLIYGRPNLGRPSIATNIAAGVCLVACVASLVLSQLSPKWRRYEDSQKRGASIGARVPSALAAVSPAFTALPSNRSIAPRGPTV
jgi:rhomboid protease GluP